MPRSLRWVAAITTGIVAQFVFQIAFLAVVTHGNKVPVSQTDGRVALGGILATILNLVAALAVNDWLSSRYPREPRTPNQQESKTPTNVG
ncbi:MAG: hypothetical protein ACYDCC_01290 [Actinomycetota bacterium]